jgi:antitoxin component YwqK of YwqJK toxin-antitoxin module
MLENNVDFCGVIKTYHDEEKTKVKEEYFTMNGKKEGIYKSYHHNGQLYSEVNYIDGKKV